MPRWFMCLCRWARLNAVKEYMRDRLRFAYPPRCRKQSAQQQASRASVETLEPRLLFSATLWDGGGDGQNWTDPLNWSDDLVPTISDDVVIDVAGDPEIVVSGNAVAASLSSTDSLRLASGGTLDVAGAASATGGLTLAGGTLLGGSWSAATQMTATGTATLDGVSLSGDLTVVDGALVYVDSGLTLDGTLTVGDGTSSADPRVWFRGTQSLSGTGSVVMTEYDSYLYVAGSSGTPATLTIDSGITVSGRGYFEDSADGYLVNQGLIRSDTTGALYIRTDTLDNQGTLEAASGTLRVEPGVSWDGSGSLAASGGNVDLYGSFTSDALDSITQNSGEVRVYGTVDNTGRTLGLDGSTGSLNLYNATIEGGTLATSGGVEFVNRGTSTLDGVSLSGDLTVVDGASVYVDNGLTLDGTLTVGNGTSSADPRIWFRGTQSLSGTGSVVMTESDSYLYVQGSSGTPATLTIDSGITVSGRGYFEDSYDGYLVNQGLIRSDTTGTLYVRTDTLDNQGTLEAASGTLRVEPGVSWDGSGSLVASGGYLDLYSSYTSDALDSITQSAGEVRVYGTIDNTGRVLGLGSSTGSLNLYNATIQGGTLATSGGAEFVNRGTTTLDGVSLSGDLTVVDGASVYVDNGLTLDGTLTVGDGTSSADPRVWFRGTQSLSGTGSVVMTEYDSYLYVAGSSGTPATLTIDSGITVSGRGYFEDSADGYLVNQGLIRSDTTGALYIRTDTLDNQGTLEAASGTLRVEPGQSFTNNGSISIGTGALWLDGVQVYANANTSTGSSSFDEGSTLTLDLDASDLGSTTWSVDWGDGQSSTLNTAAGSLDHIYADDGSFVIQATATDPSVGGFGGNSLHITVDNVAPSVSVSGPATIATGQQADFTASATDPAGSQDTLSYQWAVRLNGQSYDISGIQSDQSAFSFTPTQSGSYAVDVTVSDENGGATVFTSAMVANVSGAVTWVGASSGDWHDASNWSTGVVPGVSDDVVIDAPGLTITHASGTAHVASLISNADLRLTGGTFRVDGVMQVSADLELSGGSTLENAQLLAGGSGSTVRVTGTHTVHAMTIDADVVVRDGISLHVENGLELNGTLTVGSGTASAGPRVWFDGTQSLTGTGTVVLTEYNSDLYVNGTSGVDATLTIGSGVTVEGRGYIKNNYTGDLVNQGTIRATTGNLYINTSGLDNQNLIEADGGHLQIDVDNAVVNNGTIRIATAIGSSSMTGDTFANAGAIGVEQGTLDISSTTGTSNSGSYSVAIDAMLIIDGQTFGGISSTLSGSEIRLNGIDKSEFSDVAVAVSQDNGQNFVTTYHQSQGEVYVVGGLERDTNYDLQVTYASLDGGSIEVSYTPQQTLDAPEQYGRYRVGSIADSNGQPANFIASDGSTGGSDVYVGSLAAAAALLFPEGTLDGLTIPDNPIVGSDGNVGLYLITQKLVWDGPPSQFLTWDSNWYPPNPDFTTWWTKEAYVIQFEELSELLDSLGSSAIDDDANADGNVEEEEGYSEDPIRYYDGSVFYETTDLVSNGYGDTFGQSRSWSNTTQFVTSERLGTGSSSIGLPSLRQMSNSDSVGVVGSATDVRVFSWDGTGYVSESIAPTSLELSSSEYILTDSSGNKTVFFSFDSSLPELQRGQFKSRIDANGSETYVAAWTADGEIAEVRRKGVDGVDGESWLYSYLSTSDPNAGKIDNVQLRRPDGNGGWQIERQVTYDYYDGAELHGMLGDLKTATIQDPAGATIDTKYYRYYTFGEDGGYSHGMKYIFDAASFARLRGAVTDPFTATDAEVAPYAQQHFVYDDQRRVVQHEIQGLGGDTNDGIGIFNYAYETSSFAHGPNAWQTKTTETLPNGNQNVVYSNGLGQVMLKVFRNVNDPANPSLEGQEWYEYTRYDSEGRVLFKADSPAVTGYDETKADLLGEQNGNLTYLADHAGAITYYEYHDSTTATDTVAGGAEGYTSEIGVRHGELGADITQLDKLYYRHDGGAGTIYTEAVVTTYANEDGTGASSVQYGYTWYAGTSQKRSVETTHSAVSPAENGDGMAVTTGVFFDAYGNATWTLDDAGSVDHARFDIGTGALVGAVSDVQYGQLSATEQASFDATGWSAPVSGLHLASAMTIDGLGRTTSMTDAKGDLAYYVYNDTAHEVRTYEGWDIATGTPTGPTTLVRENRAAGYTERLTMDVVPSLQGNVPDGQEAISGIQSLSRTHVNAAGQVIAANVYFDLSGITYSSDAQLGTPGVNYGRTAFGYDARGDQNMVVNPLGTITITLRDGRDRPTAVYVGTDAGTTDGRPWTPGNAAASSNMVIVTTYEYDEGGVGSGNLTRKIDHVGSDPADDRVIEYAYDWRQRLVTTKAGVETTESLETNRPLTVRVLNNLDQVVETRIYDGDGISLVDADQDGVPDTLPADRLRAQTLRMYDALGRIYQTSINPIDQTTGVVIGSPLVTQTWYDPRGQIMKTLAPDGLTTKYQYDTSGRLVSIYLTDGAGDTTYADAGSVADDVVFREVHHEYDAAGNVILTIRKERHGDELDTAVGVLGDATTGPRARVTYQATYYDSLNRRVADVLLGTNGDVAYARPTQVPARSDDVLVTSYTYDTAGRIETVTDPAGVTTRYSYDLAGRTKQVIMGYVDGVVSDSDDATIDYVYDPGGNVVLETVRQSGGRPDQQTQYIYGVTSSEGSGLVSNDLLAETRFADPVTGLPSNAFAQSSTYNRQGEVLTQTAANGAVSQTSYDILGRVSGSQVVTTDGSGSPSTGLAYDTLGNVLTETDALGAVTAYGYDGFGRLIQTTLADPDGAGPLVSPVISQTLDAAGRVLTRTSADGQTTANTYDVLGRVVETLGSDPDGGGALQAPKTTYGYNIGGSRNTVTGPGEHAGGPVGSHTTTQHFDRFGRVEKVTQPSADGVLPAPESASTFDRLGRVLTTTDALGNTTAYTYDTLGRQVNVTAPDPDGTGPETAPVMTYGYDAVGNRVSATDANGHTTDFTYDAQNRLTKTIGAAPGAETYASPQGPTVRPETTYAYDAIGQLVSQTDPLGNTTTYGYNQLGQRTSVTLADPDGAGPKTSPVTGYTYDLNGNQLTVTDPAGNTTTYTYDKLNRTLTSTNEPGDTSTYEYDSAGRVVRMADRLGRVQEMAYDGLGRVITETWLDQLGGTVENTVSYTYDNHGRLTEVSDNTSTYSYSYDNLDRVLSIDNTGTPNAPATLVEYQYDQSSRRTQEKITVAGTVDSVIDHDYDDQGRLTQTTQTGTGVDAKRVDYTYTANGLINTIVRYSDTAGTQLVATSTHVYDDLDRLISLTHSDPANQDIATYTWGYDLAGRLIGFTNPDESASLAYDNNGQLISADHNDAGTTGSTVADEAYDYDAAGNRITANGDTYTTGDDNRLLSDGSFDYTYDAEGNRLTQTNTATGDVIEYSYDHRNRLTLAEFKDDQGTVTKRVRYTYDVNDYRIATEIDAQGDGTYESVEHFVLTDSSVALVVDGSGAVTHRYLHGPRVDLVLAEEQMGASAQTLWLLSDHQQSVRDVVSDGGMLLNHIEYDSFGNVSAQSDAAYSSRFGYTGREAASELGDGVWYYRRRFYDAGVGRFVTLDPTGFAAGDTNLYRYVSNSPWNYVDPTGRVQESAVGADDLVWMRNPFASDGSGFYTEDPSVTAQSHADYLAQIDLEAAYWGLQGRPGVDYGVEDISVMTNYLRGQGLSQTQINNMLGGHVRALSNTLNAQNEAVRYANGVLTRGEKLQGSASILGNTFSFGLTDRLGWTDTSRYQSDVFRGVGVAATVSREAAIAVATLGAGNLVSLGRGGLAARGVYNSGRLYEAAAVGQGLGNGVVDARNGNYGSAALNFGLAGIGALGLRGVDVPRSGVGTSRQFDRGAAARNTESLTDAQISELRTMAGQVRLSGDDLVFANAPSAYSDVFDKVIIGPNVYPTAAGTASNSVLGRLTPRAVIAHELGHLLTSRAGKALPGGSLLDEVQASLVARQQPGLSNVERYQLLRDAVERARDQGRRVRDLLPDLPYFSG